MEPALTQDADAQPAHIVELAAILDLNAASPLAAELLARRGEAVILDASRVERIGGQCLQVLLAAVRTWRTDAVPLTVADASSDFTQGLRRLGLAPAEFLEGAPPQ